MLVNTSNYNEGVQKTMTNITKRSLVAAGVLAALMAGNVALAADVPAGVTLAEKQTLVRNNGSEVQSLDPHKIEGVPESNICLLYTSPSPRDVEESRMPSSA